MAKQPIAKQTIVLPIASKVKGTLMEADKELETSVRRAVASGSTKSISKKKKWTPALTEAVKKDLELDKRNVFAVSDEDLLYLDDPEVLKEIIETRKLKALHKVDEQEEKKREKEFAEFKAFKRDKISPILEALSNFKFPAVHRPAPIKKQKTERAFVICAFDWHVGGKADKSGLVRGGDWSIELALQSVQKYCDKITEDVSNDKVGFDKAIIFFGGDLFNSLSGFTSNGTHLKHNDGGDKQFEAAMKAMITLCDTALRLFPTVQVHFVKGNHGGDTDYALGIAVKSWYRTEKRMAFEVYSKRTAEIKVGPVLFFLDHGASSEVRAKIPTVDAKKENYVLRLINQSKLAHLVKQKIFLMGDLHHYKHTEHNGFEFIQSGALPLGDHYADALGLHSRSSQSCFVVDPTGLRQTFRYFLDE